jgi:hypothetical protein
MSRTGPPRCVGDRHGEEYGDRCNHCRHRAGRVRRVHHPAELCRDARALELSRLERLGVGPAVWAAQCRNPSPGTAERKGRCRMPFGHFAAVSGSLAVCRLQRPRGRRGPVVPGSAGKRPRTSPPGTDPAESSILSQAQCRMLPRRRKPPDRRSQMAV